MPRNMIVGLLSVCTGAHTTKYSMRLNEIKDFYKNASKDQIRTLVENRNDTGIKNEILTEMIYAANHEEVWTEVNPDTLMEQIRAMADGKSSS